MIRINNVMFKTPNYIVTDIGDIQVAKKRVAEEGTIYGANGRYINHDGGYESSERTLKISVSNYEKMSQLITTFNEDGNVIGL